QVKELLSAFGPLKSFHLVRDSGSPTSKGYAFCEYIDPDMTQVACDGLNGMQLGDKTLTVRVAQVPDSAGLFAVTDMAAQTYGVAVGGVGGGMGGIAGSGHVPTVEEQAQLAAAMAALGGPAAAGVGMLMPIPGMAPMAAPLTGGAAESAMAASRAQTLEPTRILVLLDMVTGEELAIDSEYEDIVDDIQNECSTHGTILALVVPRPGQGLDAVVGKVFIEYRDREHARQAALSLAGRQFAERIVKVEYGDEAKFSNRDFT
ncbi:unnamed protein product, partial [Phaeothamnion confervicola]